MMIGLTEPQPFVPVFVALVEFQGHSCVGKIKSIIKQKLFSLQVLVMLKPCINGTQTLLIRENLIDGMFLFLLQKWS